MVDLDLEGIGARIKGLRGRLTQSAFADRLGIERKTVGRYEAGERAPDALALLRLMAEFDADPAWILTGSGFAPTASEDERELVALYRSAPLAGKAAAIGALKGASTARQEQVFHGNVGQAVKVEGDLNQPGVRFGGRTKKKK